MIVITKTQYITLTSFQLEMRMKRTR